VRLIVLTLALGFSLSLAACSRSEARQPASTEALEQQVVIFAASSLREAFSALAKDFEQARPGAKVTFSFAGSQELRAQIEHGSPADVFASADRKHMEELTKAARVRAPVVFARNEPVIVVARESAATIRGLRDLPAATRIVLGAPEVPIGRYSLQILERASATLGADFRSRVEAKVVSRELNVRQVLAKVSLGEAAAGIVYRTDTSAAKDGLETVAIPDEINVIAEYPAAMVADAAHPKLAAAWIALLLSPAGQQRLAQAGFLAPAKVASAP
jgi:molybdate transport system substrate-binding protein